MTSTDFFTASKKARELLIARIDMENQLHILETAHKKLVVEHQVAMNEVQKIINESKK